MHKYFTNIFTGKMILPMVLPVYCRHGKILKCATLLLNPISGISVEVGKGRRRLIYEFFSDRGEPPQRDRLPGPDQLKPEVHADRAAAAPHRRRPRSQGLPHLPRVHRHLQAAGGFRQRDEATPQQGRQGRRRAELLRHTATAAAAAAAASPANSAGTGAERTKRVELSRVQGQSLTVTVG